MNHETWDAQAAAYALGALDGQELVDFEDHLASGCDACLATVRESMEALASVGASAGPVAPPELVKAALMRRIAVDQIAREQAVLRRATELRIARDRQTRRAWLGWAMGAAAAMIVGAFLAGGFVTARYEARLGEMARETARLREQLQREAAVLQVRAVAYQEILDVLRDPATRLVTLQGAGPIPGAAGRLVWNERTGGHLVVANLPPAPEGKIYEAWTIASGKPSPAGLFQSEASGAGVHRLKGTGAPVDVFAITIEPAAGVPAPTGPIVLASQ
jgi:hypothetical protein